MSDTEENIPTLNEMIFPGRSEKPTPKTSASNSAKIDYSKIQKQIADSPLSNSEQRDQPKPKQTHFEAFINKQIDEILERHILSAREEIVRVVMLELRSRLPNTNQRTP